MRARSDALAGLGVAEAGFASLRRHSPTEINVRKGVRAPLLIVGAA